MIAILDLLGATIMVRLLMHLYQKTIIWKTGALVVLLLVVNLSAKGQARVQVIHNAADPAAAVVDLYIQDSNGQITPIDNFAFRKATPFVELPAGKCTVYVAGPNSSGPQDAIASFEVDLENRQRYVVIANGVLDPNNFADNPDGRSTQFGLLVKTAARDEGSDPTKVDLFAVHGATDAPAVDVIARGVGPLIQANSFAYGDLTDYLSVPPDVYTLQITLPGGQPTVVAYRVDLSGLTGGAAAVLASGFLNPAANQNGEGFALLAVLPDGTVLTLPLAPTEAELSGLAEVQPVLTQAEGIVRASLNGTQLIVTGNFGGLSSNYTMSHIHVGKAGQNGGVAVALNPVVQSNGRSGAFQDTLDLTTALNNISLDEFISAFFNGGLYVNIHTQNFPAGELRGQLLLTPNTAPEAPVITFPPDNASLTVQGPANTSFAPSWNPTSDPENDAVVYIWQLAASESFVNPLVNINTGNKNSFETDFGTVDALLREAGVGIGQTVTLYHRAIATDGSRFSFGPPATVQLTRGEVTPTSREETPNQGFIIHGIYPNPVSGKAFVAFDLPLNAKVAVEIFDLLGRQVMRLNQIVSAGTQRALELPDIDTLSPGLYLYRIIAEMPSGSTYQVGRMMVVH